MFSLKDSGCFHITKLLKMTTCVSSYRVQYFKWLLNWIVKIGSEITRRERGAQERKSTFQRLPFRFAELRVNGYLSLLQCSIFIKMYQRSRGISTGKFILATIFVNTAKRIRHQSYNIF